MQADPWRLFDNHSLDELCDMLRSERENTDNLNPTGSVLIYTKKAQKKIDAIADAISLHLKNRKIENGTYETSGYSGRNSNRR